MIRKFCDICDKEIETLVGDKLNFYMIDDSGLLPNWPQLNYELCPSCTEKIKNFINVLKKNG